MESKEYTKKKGGVEISLLVYSDGNRIESVCCGVVNVSGNTAGSVTMDEYGLAHTYTGDDKADVDAAVKLLQNAIAKDFGLSFAERPQMVEQENIE